MLPTPVEASMLASEMNTSASTTKSSRVRPRLKAGQRGAEGSTSWDRGSFFGMYPNGSNDIAAAAAATAATASPAIKQAVRNGTPTSSRRRRSYRESLIKPEDLPKHLAYEQHKGISSGGM